MPDDREPTRRARALFTFAAAALSALGSAGATAQTNSMQDFAGSLATLKLLETIKEGRTIWRLDAAKKSAS